MAENEIAKFQAEVQNDAALVAELTALSATADRNLLSERIAEIGKSRGYSFSAADVDDYMTASMQEGELSDEALSTVAGGSYTYSAPGCTLHTSFRCRK